MTEVRTGETEYGFIFGAAEVVRQACMPDGSVCIEVRTSAGRSISVYASPNGRSLRVFGKDAREWKPDAYPSLDL